MTSDFKQILEEERPREKKSHPGGSKEDQRILIIIPAYNEEANIQRTIEEIRALELPLSLIVIDDGSSDQTARTAREQKAGVISHPFNLGIGGAVQSGFKFA